MYLIHVPQDSIGRIGREWVATHAPRNSTYAEVMELITSGLTFGSSEKNVLTNGVHVWVWRPSDFVSSAHRVWVCVSVYLSSAKSPR